MVPGVLSGWTSRYSDDDNNKEYEMVGQDDLPDFPTPIAVTGRRSKAQWTISIPPGHDFPLTTREYSDMCAKCREVAARVYGLRSNNPVAMDQINLMREDSKDKYFMDVHEAEKLRILPGLAGSSSSSSSLPNRDGDLLGVDKNGVADNKAVCASSLTYVLESEDAGLGKTLMSLWMAYGLAKREGRAFFLEDARWAYGDYTSMFELPPIPDCRPPPRHQMIPCPRQARHLVVTSGSASELLAGHIDPEDTFLEGVAAGLDQRPAQRELYELARVGYEALFRLTAQDREYVFNRVIEHKIKTYAVDGAAHNGHIIGVHVRHGDRHPLEFQYADSYIPLTQYVDAAENLLNTSLAKSGNGYHNNNHNNHDDDPIARAKSFLVLASDDPLVYEADEFRGAVRAQELIRLAGKGEVSNEQENNKPKAKNVMHKFTDETFGWEGGFFAAMFWNLGISSATAANNNAAATASATAGSVNGRVRAAPSAEATRLHSLVGRAYMMDLAVLADMTAEEGGGVVCAVSSMGCRLLAVMMGYERAFGRKEWKNVDGEFGWSGFSW